MKFRLTYLSATLGVFLLAASLAPAQSKEEFEELKKQLLALQQKTAQLEKRLAASEAKPAVKNERVRTEYAAPAGGGGKAVVAVEEALVTADENGFVIKSADDKFRLRIGGLIHADSRVFLEDGDDNDFASTFLLRRVRPILEGKIYDDFGFRIMPDFGGGTAVLQDAYIDYTRWEAAQIRVGKFKEPVGLERLQSASDLLFVERGLPTNLVPNRDLGVQLSGAFLDKAINYQVGVFNGVNDGGSGDFDNNDDKDLAGRLWLQPFKQAAPVVKGLNIGVAGTYGLQNGSLPVYRSPAQQTFFNYSAGTVADGTRWRITPQAYYSFGPFGLLAEYVHSEQEIAGPGGVRSDGGAEAWQVAASYVLSGENASFKGVKPKHNFGQDGGWGSWEIVARYGELEVNDDAFDSGLASISRSARSAQSFGAGLNWNLNKNVRAMLNYEHTNFDGGSTTGDRSDEDAILTRLQLGF